MTTVSTVRDPIDATALQRWMKTHVEGAGAIRTISQYTFGKANLTYLIVFEDGALGQAVLRRPPTGPLPTGGHDMAREHYVLERLWRGFPLAPRGLAFCDDPSIIGAPFVLMEKKSGVVVQDTVPEIFGSGRDIVANELISTTVVETLAMLHAVDPSQVGLDRLGKPSGFLERQVVGWTDRMLSAGFGDPSSVLSLRKWLMSDIPKSQRVSILHNDWRLDNLALSPEDPSSCTAVYDWDMCTRGDPLADLGTLMATWYEHDEWIASFAPTPTLLPGFLSPSQAISKYEHASGLSTDRFDWYVVFGTVKLAAILQQIYSRWDQGTAEDDRFEEFGPAATQLVDLAQMRRKSR